MPENHNHNLNLDDARLRPAMRGRVRLVRAYCGWCGRRRQPGEPCTFCRADAQARGVIEILDGGVSRA